jgi:precorrin-6A synthase
VKKLRIIGMGPGGVDQLTVEAVHALNEVDVFFVFDKGIDDLIAVRQAILDRHTDGRARLHPMPDPERDRDPTSYENAVSSWHEKRAVDFEEAIASIQDDEVGGFLTWGDPTLYDSTARIMERVLERGNVSFEYDLVAGLSSVQLLTAGHRIMLNRVGESVVYTTGRRLAERAAAGDTDLVVMLDGHLQCAELEGEWDIWWGANLGTPDEVLVAGPLADVLGEIRAARAAAKKARGWVMDVYLLRR